MKTIKEPYLVQIGPVRVSFPDLVKPRVNDINGKTQYGIQVWLPKGQTAPDIAPNAVAEATAFKQAMDATFAEKFGKNAKPTTDKPIMQDGDQALRKSDGTPKAPGYWMFRASCNEEHQPPTFDGRGNPIHPKEIYGGCWAYVTISLFAYEHKVGGRGVGAGLRAVQFYKNGERFGGGDDFDMEALDGADEIGTTPDTTDNTTHGNAAWADTAQKLVDEKRLVAAGNQNGKPDRYDEEDDPFKDS